MNKKIKAIFIINIFLISGLFTSAAVGKNVCSIEENKILNNNIGTIKLDIQGGICYTIIIENEGVLPLHLKDAKITVKRGNEILDEWTWKFTT